MFILGLKHGALVISATIIVLALSSLISNKEITEFIVGTTVIISWLIVGYFFKKQNGSIFTVAIEPKKKVYGAIF